jgi:RNA polymerase sigma-70 factor (ECF subfamily)
MSRPKRLLALLMPMRYSLHGSLRLVALPRLDALVDDESELVAAACAGGTAAQAELFRRHAPQLLPLLKRLLASTADAEDALQDTFVLAFRDLAQLRDASAFGGWLRGIAVHQAHRRFRRRRFWAALGLDRSLADARLADLADPAAGPEVHAELTRLDDVLARLAPRDRVAWMLRYVEGCELGEVAASCGCSLATAKRRIAAAQARVVRHLGES